MKAICIEVDSSVVLKMEQEYYVFPAGPEHYYVSRFDNVNANFGCYLVNKFKLVNEKKCLEESVLDIPNLKEKVELELELVLKENGQLALF